MRLFIAINFNKENEATLYATLQKLKCQSISGNFTQRENLHLTLAFIGETPNARLNDIKTAMSSFKAKAFELVCVEGQNAMGKFRRDEGDLYWLGVNLCEELLYLQKELTKALKEQGFSLEERPYKPHLTLGRKVVPVLDFSQMQFAANLKPIREHVEKISLMKSERINGKLVYTEIYAKQLE